ncbi:MAG: amino acid adenylation domain-containing protein, partial [Actinomycetota bacterium]|nr:amino acid adenylation domain-containing protein [Actinomycetota bacterium]
MSYLLHHLLEASAQRHPEALAVADGSRTISYGELDRRANQVARLLAELGVERGDRVGIYLEKSLEAMLGIYGTLKAGASYVPLDPHAPVARAAYIAGNCQMRALLSSRQQADAWQEVADGAPSLGGVVMLDGHEEEVGEAPSGVKLFDRRALEAMAEGPAAVRSIDADLAYILYTSGSTGEPKGVMLSHRNGLAFVEWAAQEFAVGAEDRLSSFAPLHFDLSTFDLFAAALAGASVHLVPRQASMFPMQVRQFLEGNQISVVYVVPTVLTMLVQRAKLEVGDLPALRAVLFAGEVFPTKYLSRLMMLLPHVEFANLYGPTETNVCTFYRVPEPPPEEDPPISIGRAIDNVDTFVVTDQGTRGQPGEAGELYVRGSTVMHGYWGDPQRTARSRVGHPFAEQLADPVYKTGDLVVEGEDGNYTFLG